MSETSLSVASSGPYDNSHQDRLGEIVFKALIKTGYLVYREHTHHIGFVKGSRRGGLSRMQRLVIDHAFLHLLLSFIPSTSF